MLKPLRSARNAILVLVGFVVLTVSVIANAWIFEMQRISSQWIRHTLESQKAIETINLETTDAESAARGYVITGNQTFLDEFSRTQELLNVAVGDLARQTADNPRQQSAIELLQPAIQAKIQTAQHAIELKQGNQTEEAQAFARSGQGRATMATVRNVLRSMEQEEDRLLASRTVQLERSVSLGRLIWTCSIAGVLALAVFVLWDSRRRFLLLEETNQRLATEAVARNEAQGQVRQLQKIQALGQLTGGIAHDFNNMLAIVIGSLDLAARRLTGAEHPQLAQFIKNASDGAKKAAALTARLLAFSRQLPLEPQVTDANKLVAQTSEILRRTLGESIKVETVLAGGLWRVFADAAQIESALLNLCLNSRDAMPNGGRLTIETANTDLDDAYARGHDEVLAGQYVMISVTDTGTGMEPTVLDRAFDPFFTTKGVGQGSGLGLSQVYGFIKQSKGHVKIYSEVSHGTSVKIYLPRHLGAELQTSPRPTAKDIAPYATGSETILVVEDEREVRRTTVIALQDLGYRILEAGHAKDALAIIEGSSGIHLLFTDIVMPDISGRQLADAALVIRPMLKVLYTTGYTRNAIVHNGVVDQDVVFISKPFSLEELARKVRSVLDAT